MKHLRAFALSIIAALSLGATASAGESMLVVAGNGPHGVAVRWFGTGLKNGESATISRIDAGKTTALATVTMHVNTRTGVFAEFVPLASALANGEAFVDTHVKRGESVRYQVSVGTTSASTSGAVRVQPGHIDPSYAIAGVRGRAALGGVRIAIAQRTHAAAIAVIERERGGAYRVLGSTIPLESGKPAIFFDATAPIGVTTHYRVHLEDLFGNASARSVALSVVARDLRAPLAVHLQARAAAKAVLLVWSHPASAPVVAGFDVYRRPFHGTFAKIASVAAGATSYRDNAPPGPSYEYAVRARSTNGVEGAPSNGVFAFVKKTTPPDAPSGLVARRKNGAIALRWNASHDPTTFEYLVYRRDGKAAPVLLTSLATATRTYVDRLPAGSITTYAYGVGAMDTSGNRAQPSRWVDARVLRAALPVPNVPLAGRYRDGAVILTLEPMNDPDVHAFAVERAEDGATSRVIGHVRADAASFRDPSAVLGHRYTYWLRDAAGRSRGTIVALGLAGFVPPAPHARYLGNDAVEVVLPKLPAGTHVDIVRRIGTTYAVVARGFSGTHLRDRIVGARSYRVSYAIVVHGAFDASARSAFSQPAR